MKITGWHNQGSPCENFLYLGGQNKQKKTTFNDYCTFSQGLKGLHYNTHMHSNTEGSEHCAMDQLET